MGYEGTARGALLEEERPPGPPSLSKKQTKPTGRKKPNRRKVPLGTALEPALLAALSAASLKEQRNKNVLISRALEKYLALEHPDLWPPNPAPPTSQP